MVSTSFRDRQPEREGCEESRGSSGVLEQPSDGEDREGRGQGSMFSPSCHLIGRDNVRRAELNLIRNVRHQLQFKDNNQPDTAGGARPFFSHSSLHISKIELVKQGENICENVLLLLFIVAI